MKSDKQTVIHLASAEYIQSEAFYDNISLIGMYSCEHDIKNVIFFEGKEEAPILLNSPCVKIINYLDEKELIDRIKLIAENENIIFVNVFVEKLIDLTNKIRKIIGQKISDNPELLTNKEIQIETLLKNDSSLAIVSYKVDTTNYNYEELEKKLGDPFILKAFCSGINIGTVKIKNEKSFAKHIKDFLDCKDKNITKQDVLIVAEEFVDADLYSIDYYVDQEGQIILTKPIKEISATRLGSTNFFMLSQFASKDVEKECDFSKIPDFITKNVQTLGIRNTFINHVFKIDKKGNFKTFDIIGKIGWRRIPFYNTAYGVNLYTFLFEGQKEFDLQENTAFFKIFPCEDGVLKGFNTNLWQKVDKLESVYKVRKEQKFVGQRVGLSDEGLLPLAFIDMKNKNFKQFKKDLDYVEENYCDLLDVEQK